MQLQKYEKRENTVSDSTINSRISALNKFESFIDHDDEPTPEDVGDWIDHLIDEHGRGNTKAGTIKQYFKAVKYYFQKIHGDAEDIEHIRDWIPTGETDHGDFLQKEELNLMRRRTYQVREKAFIELMYKYARRPGEVRLLNLDDITLSDETEDMEEGKIKFSILKKKEPFRATYRLDRNCEKLLKSYLNFRTDHVIEEPDQSWMEGPVKPLFTTSQGRISHTTVWRNIKKTAARAGIDKNITPKSMRHSRTTHLQWDGQSPEVIASQQLLHDPDSNVVGHYIHPRDEDDIRDVMQTSDEK